MNKVSVCEKENYVTSFESHIYFFPEIARSSFILSIHERLPFL